MGECYQSRKAGLLFVFAVLLSFSVHSGASEGGERTEVFGAKTGVRKLARNGGVRYVEVEITLSEEFDLAYISGLPRAAGNEPEVSEDGGRVKVQLPGSVITELLEAGAEFEPVRNFVLIEGSGGGAASIDGDIGPLATCEGPHEYGFSDEVVKFMNDDWWGSGIDFSGSSVTSPVNCIDIHYVVKVNSWNLFYVSFSEEDYETSRYLLVGPWWGSDGDINETKTGITEYNGELINQMWILWGAEDNADGKSYIESWWIKLYYEDYEEDYCVAWGAECYTGDYISRVQVGDIDNVSGCDNYGDYTSLSTSMEIGDSYSIQVDNYNAYDDQDQCGIWVDWNQDLDFYDAGETIAVSDTPGVGPYTATITPPVGAALGATRMRIRIRGTGAVVPCDATTYGDVEDYTITVTALPITFSGYVRTEDSTAIEGVLMTGTNGASTDTTDENGFYEITVPINPWTGEITPSKTCWSFNPAVRGYANMTSGLSNQNFTGTRVCYYGGGFGTSQTPYLIYTAEHMQEIGTRPEHWFQSFKLMNNIDLSGYAGDSFNIIGYYNDSFDNEPFSGSFDGNGYNINNFTYSTVASEVYIGIFGYVSGFNPNIKNVSLIDPVIDAGSSDVVGSLVGWSSNADIVSCSVSGGSVSGNNLVGGLVGQAGFMGYTTLINCYADTDVSGNSDVGGLLGWVFDATLSLCHSSGSVLGTEDVGGLVGENSDEVFNCYSRSAVSGSTNIGGLVGYNNTSLYTAEILNCYSSGQISGTSDVGGLVGSDNNGSYTKSFWDSDINPDVNGIGDTSDPNVTGETTEHMQTASTFTSAGWDFVDIWTINEGLDYPIHVVSGPLTATISGYVKTSTGVAIEGVLMSVPIGTSDTTDTNGYYACVVPIAWNGSVMAIKELWSFDPMLRGYNRVITDISNENYIGTYTGNTSPTISGYVKTSEGNGIWGVLISADTGESVTTDSDGYYELTVSAPEPWNGIVTPSKVNWEFDPASIVHTNLTDDTTDHNYTGTYTAVGDWDINLSRYNIIDLGIISDIGVPGFNRSYAYAINNSGQVVGSSTTSAGIKFHAFFWEDANDNGQADPNEMQDLGLDWGDVYSIAYGINNIGQVVGAMNMLQLHTQPYLWEDTNHNGRYDTGEIQYLDLLPITSRSYAYDISDNELVVGNCETIDGTYACLWDLVGDTVTNLGTLGGDISKAYGINNAGMVVGGAHNISAEEHAFLWMDGNGNGSSDPCEMLDIGTLGGNYSRAYSVNNTGQIVGDSEDANGDSHAFFWEDQNSNGQSDPCEMLDLGHFGGNTSRALSINDDGSVVGFSRTIEGDINSGRSFYWDSTNGLKDLFSLVCNPYGWQHLVNASGINNHGQIVGAGITDDGEYHAFLMTPVLNSDLDCDIDVDIDDLGVLCEQWLLEELSWDVGPEGGDGFVDFLDWSYFADGWHETTDMDDLGDFVVQWMRPSAYCADIAPKPDGDGFVDMLDFAVLAENWLEGF